MSMTEMKEQREKLKREAEVLKQMELEAERQRQEAQQKLLENRGCGWGMGEDAEDDANEENPFASLVPENESLYIDDPKKALKGFYEREGCDLPDYQFTEVAMGKHKCVLDLPVDGPNGEELVAEVVVSGKRKDAVIACALEACRMLDKLGMLRSSKHESRKRKQKKWEDDDFYDSDEDTFLDRTGTIEKKRFMRMKKAGKDEAETYESLMEKYNKVVAQIQDTESQLEKAKAEADARVSEDIDELDAYMNSIKSGAMDTKTRMRLKGDLLRLRVEEQKLRKLVNIAQPASLPPLKQPSAVPVKPPAADSLSRKLHAQQKLQKKGPPVKTAQQTEFEQKPDDFEEQDEEEEEGENTHISDKTKESSAKKPSSSPTSSSKFENVQTNEKKISRNNVQTSKTAVKGPTLPPKDVSKKSRERHANVMSTAAVLNAEKAQQKISKSYEENDPDYAMWLPPEEQSGDGRTSLNDKLGY
ncbi:kanadaptin isoform X2 [Aplysia californica]|nr:kanadaptin isoform X2 [Aplysia californica]